MDFFAHQDAARRASRRLTLLFAIAVIAIVVAVNLVVIIGVGARNPALIGLLSVGTLVVILGGSLFQIASLRDGGAAVCEMMDGRRLVGGSTDFDEKRLMNVVEEMALAAGVSVPLVYVLDHEDGLNAFAAGFSPNDAAIAVTRGLLRTLNRDELQGVIGHEFSHVLNGDMRLNIRMIGLLFGIEMIGHCGRLLIRSSREADDVRAVGAIGGIGLGLFVVGFVGVFAADIIRAAIGRQREYLADASSVQFTRNPEGIGSALVKIAAASGLIGHRNTDMVSHMLLAGGVQSRLDGMLATHPPIDDRIERVLGKGGRARLLDAERTQARRMAAAADTQATGFGRSAGAGGFGRAAGVLPMAQSVDQVVATIGNPDADHIDHIHKLLHTLPDAVRTGLATPDGAKGILLGLLAPEAVADTDLRGVLEGQVDLAVLEQARWLAGPLATLDGHLKLPVAALAFPVLRALPIAERERFVQAVRAIVAADDKVTPFEFALTAMLRQQLGERGASRGQARRVVPLKLVEADVATLLSLFVRAASQGSTLFDPMAAKLGLTGAELLAPSRVSLTAVEVALARLVHLAPADKARLIRVCLEAVFADSRVSVREGELMRAVCAVLDTPLPPIIERSAVVPETAGVSV